MKPCRTVLFLMASGLCMAGQPEWLESLRASGEDVLRQMEKTCERVDAQISALDPTIATPQQAGADDSMPEAEDGGIAAVADGGLLVDRENATLAYIGNVRVREPRLQLRCSNRLYIRLPSSTLKEGEKKAKDTVTSADADKADPKADAPQAADTDGAATPQEPVVASAYDAMVDSVESDILLRSKGGEGMPHIRYGANEVTLEPMADGSDSYLLADHNGDAHLRAGHVTLHWADAQGRTGTLTARNGRLEFNRGRNTLYIEGPTEITMPDGSTLTAEESLCVTLHEAPGAKAQADGAFLAQFSGMNYDGVEKAEACGNVVATRPAKDGQPAAQVCGGTCSYNGLTGECALTGKDCRLTYGQQVLRTQDSITLAANGDITIHGEEISGTYALPPRKDGGAAAAQGCGTFRTGGEIKFCAADGTVTIPNGLQAQDSSNHFSCTGPLVVQLKRTAAGRTPADRVKTGMLNLAVADYGDISTVDATGDVDMAYTDEAKKQALHIQGDSARFDIGQGTARISAGPGRTALLSYGSYTITAQGGTESSMGVDGQGDIEVAGEDIHAELPFQKDHAVVDCHTLLKLDRQVGAMEIGPGSTLTYPEGVMTANGTITAKLSPGDKQEKPLIERYPHISYNFGGVEKADTLQGGTLRTEKASMQCSGPISVVFAPAPPPSGKPAKGGKAGTSGMERITATASGDVAILAKDATGRLLRATGDKLIIDGAAGTKTLTGNTVTLADPKNTHTATGKGARVTVDRNNNARISGERQVTTATRIQEQTGKKDKKKH